MTSLFAQMEEINPGDRDALWATALDDLAEDARESPEPLDFSSLN